MLVLIAGCGYVGTALARELAARGDEVVALRRSPERVAAAPDPRRVRLVAADLLDPAGLARSLDDALRGRAPDALVHCAAAADGSPAAYRAAYVDALEHALAAARERGCARALFTSSTGVYGEDGGAWVDEDTEPRPAAETGRILLEGERLVAGSGMRPVVVRLAGIYGPGRDRLVRSVRDGTARLPLAPVYTNRIHRDDAAGLAAHLLALEEPLGLYVGADDEPADRAEVLAWIARELGLPAPQREDRAPRGLNKRCRNARLRAAGYRLRRPTFREGYGDLLAPADEGR